ncbi:PKD repeat protein [Methanolinea mesophila]|uniref:PKD domain-containing protein n=1 Tax=Methanolinea mesophila TaxID=547055 RepID=UPI001FD7E77E|nr:PKD domain-containing protein [Methanolinea mesophila]MBP1928166.1 PKD repeat protein [Methanolinea mesophila]
MLSRKISGLLIALALFALIGPAAAFALTAEDVHADGIGGTATMNFLLDEAPNGLAGFNITVSLADPDVGEIMSVSYPAWVSQHDNATLPADSAWIKTVDMGSGDYGNIGPGATDIPLGTITLRGDAEGTTGVIVTINQMSDDEGSNMFPTVTPGTFTVIVPPVAEFSANQTSGDAPLIVLFTDESTGDPTSWAWNFGDSETSDEQNPVHTYAAAGNYTVTLTASNSAGNDDETKTDYITANVAVPAPTADFNADQTSGIAPLSVQFTDTSTGSPDTWSWNFGDSATSEEQNPTHIFTDVGTYTVTLTVTNAGGSDTETKTWLIKATTEDGLVPLVAPRHIFINVANPDGVKYDLDGALYSGPADTYYIKADGGGLNELGLSHTNETAVAKSRTNTSQGSGAFYLTNTGGRGYDDDLILCLAVKGPIADDFSVNLRSSGYTWTLPTVVNALPTDPSYNAGGIDLTFHKEDFQYGPQSWKPGPGDLYTPSLPLYVGEDIHDESNEFYLMFIDLGVGNMNPGKAWPAGILPLVDNGAAKVEYTFSNMDTMATFNGYGWTYLANQGQGISWTNSMDPPNYSEFIVTGIVEQVEPPVAAFTANVTSGTIPFAVQFADQSTGNPTSWAWDFGDSGTSDEQDPVHTYTAAGTYTVSLTATNDGGSDTATEPDYITSGSGPSIDTLFNGTVTLASDGTFTVVPYQNLTNTCTVNSTTPLGALNAASQLGSGFTYLVTDKKYYDSGILMLDGVGSYLYNKTGTVTKTWICQVNGVTLDDYTYPATDGLNLKTLQNGDQVDYYYGIKPITPANATAAVKITVRAESAPGDWSLTMRGKVTRTITRADFEDALACLPSGHSVTWTDANGAVWGGIPLWTLVGMVDDIEGGSHYTFNDALAAEGYSVKVKAPDYNTSLSSADIARNDGYIVANTLNGTALPETTDAGKPCWPLMLKGSAVFGGQQVGGMNEIELVGLPEPPAGWTLSMEGDVTDVITQEYFEQAIACHHNVTYTDAAGAVWTGVPLWDLVGSVDDIETTNHWTFNDTRATDGYTVRVIAGDGYNRTFASADVSHNNGFIVANTLNGTALTGTSAPLKIVGPATTSGGQRVGNIATIRLEGLPSYPAGEYNLTLKGKIGDVINQPELETWIAQYGVDYTDPNGAEYHGIPLWMLMGWVDDRIPTGASGFNDLAAAAGYKVIVKAGDGYSKEFTSGAIGKDDRFIVANTLNGTALPQDGSHPPWPLRLVGGGATGSNSVGNIAEIELTDFQTPVEAPPLHIVKYAADGVTVVNETTVTREWMEQNLAVVGDGTTVYRFEAITSNTSNIWDPEETYPGGYKIANAVKGSRVRDLCELVGGMGSGTDIKFIASDGYETTLPYSSIYTDPAVQERQGDAILAWYADGNYVPAYVDGMRLFFTPGGDHVYGQWDMHETLPSTYWHYYYDQGTQFPSCAGLSAKLITTINIYSEPSADWTLVLDGTRVGGLNYTVSKNYFEQALACQFGSNHSATYTDSSGRIWEGMPLWFLCGFVDDADQHSSNSYNDTLALAGYNITVSDSTGYSATFDSRYTIRTTNYLMANTLNGSLIAETDSSWPLRLVGANVTGSKSVRNVASVVLSPIAAEVPTGPTISVVPASNSTAVDGVAEYRIIINTLPEGLSGYDLVVSLGNTSVADIVGVSYPAWGSMSNTGTLPGDSVRISCVDVDRLVQDGAANQVLATVSIAGTVPGTSEILLSEVHMDDDDGAVMTPDLVNGQVSTFSELAAGFSANTTSGTVSPLGPFTVAFTDESTGSPLPTSFAWTFGDGNTSSDENPVTRYFQPGLYTVSLTVSNAYTSDALTVPDYIAVTRYVKPFPGYANPPLDPDTDYFFEDINGNGRLDYDDVVVFYQNMQWIRDQADVGILPYDFNGNGRIDYDDVVLLYWEVLESP